MGGFPPALVRHEFKPGRAPALVRHEFKPGRAPALVRHEFKPGRAPALMRHDLKPGAGPGSSEASFEAGGLAPALVRHHLKPGGRGLGHVHASSNVCQLLSLLLKGLALFFHLDQPSLRV